MRGKPVHVIYNDGEGVYFVSVSSKASDIARALGHGWHTGDRSAAREFKSRALAAAVLKSFNYMNLGWRVLTVWPVTKS